MRYCDPVTGGFLHNAESNRFRLEARIAEARAAELASLTYPVYREGTWYKQTDSARVVDGRIHFEGEIPGITPAYLTFETWMKSAYILYQAQCICR